MPNVSKVEFEELAEEIFSSEFIKQLSIFEKSGKELLHFLDSIKHVSPCKMSALEIKLVEICTMLGYYFGASADKETH